MTVILANTLAMDLVGVLCVTLSMMFLGWARDLYRASRRRGPGGRIRPGGAGLDPRPREPRPLPATLGGAAQIR
jgi:hypothetical protein